jgi:hypothetical protein
MAVSGQVIVKFDLQQTNVLDLATATVPISFTKTWTFTDGAGANQVDQVWSDTRTLSASATEDLDLAGVLTNSFGVTVSFARVKVLWVAPASGNTNNVQVGGAAAAQFVNWVANSSDIVNVRPNGGFLLVAPDATGYAVTATTADLLKFANSAAGTGVTYDIVIIGSLT